jgi:hypothetical protein
VRNLPQVTLIRWDSVRPEMPFERSPSGAAVFGPMKPVKQATPPIDIGFLAQREASEAYIKSQTHEGWRLVAMMTAPCRAPPSTALLCRCSGPMSVSIGFQL